MERTGVVIDRRYMDHYTGPEHPERPDRIAVLLPVIDAMAETITRIPARAASGEDLALIQDPAYVEDVAATVLDALGTLRRNPWMDQACWSSGCQNPYGAAGFFCMN